MAYKLDPNYTYLIARRGDNVCADPEIVGWRDGMFTGYDGADWPEGLTLSDATLARNFVARYKKSDKQNINDKSKPGKDNWDHDIPTEGYIDYESLGKVTDVDGNKYDNEVFLEMLRSPDVMPVFNFQTEPSSSLKDARTKDWKNTVSVIDHHLVSSGSYTVGSAGDYPTWGGAAGAVADITTLTANLTFTQITATSETTYAQSSANFGAHTLTYQSNTPHSGDPTGGLKISYNQAGAGQNGFAFYNASMTTGKVVFKDLYQYVTDGSSAITAMVYIHNTPGTFEISDMLMRVGGVSSAGFSFTTAAGGTDFTAKNVNTWDVTSRGYTFPAGFVGTIKLANCNVKDPEACFDMGSTSALLENCTGDGNSIYDFYLHSNCTGNGNSSSDATAADGNWASGVGNLSGVNTSACVKSTDDTSSDFYVIFSAGPWNGTGITNTLDRPTDIRGVKVPGISGTSIGVSEFLTDYNCKYIFNDITIDSGDKHIADTNYRLTTTVDSDTATINVGGDFEIGLDVTWNTSGTEYINFDSSISATPVFNDNTVGNVVVNKTGGSSVTLQGDLNCYALSALAGDFDQNGQVIITSATQNYEGGGTLTLDTSSTILQDADYIIGSGWTTLDVSAAEVDLRGSGDIKSNIYNANLGKITLANTGSVTTNNGSNSIGTYELVLSGGTLLNNQELIVSVDNNTDLSLDTNHIISGTSAFIIQATSGMDLTVSGINVIAPLHIRTQLTTSAGTLTLNGDLTTSGDVHIYRYGGGNAIININDDINITGDLNVGND